MRKIHLVIPIVTIFLVSLLAACGGQPTPAAPQPSEVVSTEAISTESVSGTTLFDGKPVADFFQGSCARCHGADRSGGRGPALLPDRLTETDEHYFEIIKNGESGGMPAWGSQLTDEEITALIAFLRSEPE